MDFKKVSVAISIHWASVSSMSWDYGGIVGTIVQIAWGFSSMLNSPHNAAQTSVCNHKAIQSCRLETKRSNPSHQLLSCNHDIIT